MTPSRRVVLSYRVEGVVELLSLKVYNGRKCEEKITLTYTEILQIPYEDIQTKNVNEIIIISNGRRRFQVRTFIDSNDDSIVLSLRISQNDGQCKRTKLSLSKSEIKILHRHILQDITKERETLYSLTQNTPNEFDGK